MDFIISPLEATGRSASSLKKEPFNSGQLELDRYLKQYAKKNDDTGVAKTFVAVPATGNQVIAGYYSCSASQLDRRSLPTDMLEKLPNYPLPAMLIGKLAVDRSMQGRGLGRQLLLHAFENAIDVSQKWGVYAVRVDAIDEAAKEFYQRFGFLQLQGTPVSLYIPIKTIKQALNLSGG